MKIISTFVVMFHFLILNSETLAEVDGARSGSLSTTTSYLNSRNTRFFATACRVTQDHLGGHVKQGEVVVFLSYEGEEVIYLGGAEFVDDLPPLMVAHWKEGIRPGMIDAQGGVWSLRFAASIYDQMKRMPFQRYEHLKLEELKSLSDQAPCLFDFLDLK